MGVYPHGRWERQPGGVCKPRGVCEPGSPSFMPWWRRYHEQRPQNVVGNGETVCKCFRFLADISRVSWANQSKNVSAQRPQATPRAVVTPRAVANPGALASPGTLASPGVFASPGAFVSPVAPVACPTCNDLTMLVVAARQGGLGVFFFTQCSGV